MRSRLLALLAVCVVATLMVGCMAGPKPEEFFEPLSLEKRQIKRRVFESGDEVRVLDACSEVLLDNGFQIFEAESRLGWISAGKFKYIPGRVPAWVGATVLVSPLTGKENATAVRLSFHGVDDAEIYQDFFGQISRRFYEKASLQ